MRDGWKRARGESGAVHRWNKSNLNWVEYILLPLRLAQRGLHRLKKPLLGRDLVGPLFYICEPPRRRRSHKVPRWTQLIERPERTSINIYARLKEARVACWRFALDLMTAFWTLPNALSDLITSQSGRLCSQRRGGGPNLIHFTLLIQVKHS